MEGNKRLNEAFKLTGNLFLFFSVNGSGRFCGLAQMRSRVDFEKHLPHWEEEQKWKGLFYLEWIFVKDIPNKNLRYITNKYAQVFLKIPLKTELGQVCCALSRHLGDRVRGRLQDGGRL